MSIFIAAITICSCSKNKAKLPVISTKSVTEISQTSATSGGEVTDDGGAPITSRGSVGILLLIQLLQTVRQLKVAGQVPFRAT